MPQELDFFNQPSMSHLNEGGNNSSDNNESSDNEVRAGAARKTVSSGSSSATKKTPLLPVSRSAITSKKNASILAGASNANNATAYGAKKLPASVQALKKKYTEQRLASKGSGTAKAKGTAAANPALGRRRRVVRGDDEDEAKVAREERLKRREARAGEIQHPLILILFLTDFDSRSFEYEGTKDQGRPEQAHAPRSDAPPQEGRFRGDPGGQEEDPNGRVGLEQGLPHAHQVDSEGHELGRVRQKYKEVAHGPRAVREELDLLALVIGVADDYSHFQLAERQRHINQFRRGR